MREPWQRLTTVRARTTVAATVLVGVAVAVASLALVVTLHRSLVTHVDDVADVQAADVAGLAAQGSLPRALTRANDDGTTTQVVDAGGRVVAATADLDERLPIAGFLRGARTIGKQRVVAQPARTPTGPVTIYVATSLEPVDEAISRLGRGLALGGPLLVLFVGLTTWVVVGRALRPVELIRAQVAEISDRSLGRRVPVPTANDEIRRLATTMNTMLDRVETGVGRQRRFVADASHELQTPLASFRTDLEVALAHPAATDWPTTGGDLLATSAAMERLVRDLLFLARADDAAVAPVSPVDLDDVVLEEVHALRARGRVPVEAAKVSGAAVLGRRDDLARVVRNLLDNADRYASSCIALSLTTEGEDVVLTVTDDGPGIPAADRERVFERFTRLDDARARATGGSGLGLAIARQVVTAHGGTIEATDDGLVVRLPSA
ncbi:MAG: Signal transduction histidine kinase [Acidimicrobiales bacterium]|nr:Signal transduction histidine kinase [Acidimicrobiales bacterium]